MYRGVHHSVGRCIMWAIQLMRDTVEQKLALWSAQKIASLSFVEAIYPLEQHHAEGVHQQ